MFNFSTFSVGGCWGQPMLLFQKLIDETQMPKLKEHTDTFIITSMLFLVGLRGIQSLSIWVETPCTLENWKCLWKKRSGLNAVRIFKLGENLKVYNENRNFSKMVSINKISLFLLKYKKKGHKSRGKIL